MIGNNIIGNWDEEGCMTWYCVYPLAIWLRSVKMVGCGFGNLGKVSMCELRMACCWFLVHFEWFQREGLKLACLIDFEKSWKWLVLKMALCGFVWKTWFLGIFWQDITWTTNLCFVPNLFRNEIGSGMSMPFEERVKNDLKWESYDRRKIGGWICEFCSF